MSYVWINGQLVDKSEARISVFDHGFLYGDGVWEHLRVFGGKLFRPETHIGQLFQSLTTLQIEIPYSAEELISAIDLTVRANHRTESYVRLVVTRGAGSLGPDPRKLVPQIVIMAEEYRPFPADLYEHGLHAATWGHFNPWNPSHSGRALAPLHLVLAKQHALSEGCLEAVIFLHQDVIRSIEGLFFLVEEGIVRPVLSGCGIDVVCDVVEELAKLEGLPIVDDDVVLLHTFTTRHTLFAADELFLAGTSCGVIGIVQLDGMPIGNGKEGPITKRIREAYRKLTRGE